jgi:hypothetical protein
MDDSDSTVTEADDFFGLGGEAREALTRGELLGRVTALMQSCEGCESVVVVDVTPLDRPDTDGCNWSFTLVLEAAGVTPEVYGLGYAQVIALARSSWNLE